MFDGTHSADLATSNSQPARRREHPPITRAMNLAAVINRHHMIELRRRSIRSLPLC